MKLGPINFAFALFAVVCCASAASSNAVTYIHTPLLRAYPYVYSTHSSSLVTPTQQQYHTQDDLGQYAYGYAEPHSAKQEVRSLDGITRGSYSYRDAAGKLQTVDYTADDNGFHVAATNLPRAPVVPDEQQQQPFREEEPSDGVSSTTDVATARGNHASTHREDLLRLGAGGKHSGESVAARSDAGNVQLPQPVADTVAVAAAKADHFRRYAQEKQLHQFIQQERVISPISSAIIPSIYHYGYPWRYYYY